MEKQKSDFLLVRNPGGDIIDYAIVLENANKQDIYNKNSMGLKNTISNVIHGYNELKKRKIVFRVVDINTCKLKQKKDNSGDFEISDIKNKPFYCGGKIPKNMLINCDNILTVINYDIIDSVKKSYFFLRNHDSATQLLGEVTGDIRLVSSILHRLSAENVPQQFAGGMLILYLKYVEGVEVE